MDAPPHASKAKLLGAALQVIRTKGYTATTVDDICAHAGVTKGSFFHHFRGKHDLALAAVEHWNTMTGELFARAPYRRIADPRDRLLAYIDFRAELLRGELPDFTCLLGTLVQETFDTHPQIRDACNAGIARHAHLVAEDLAAAKALYVPRAKWQPEAVGYFTQAVIQGAFILAKAQGSAQVAARCIDQLRGYLDGLLSSATRSSTAKERTK